MAGIIVGILFQLFAPQVFQADPGDLSAGQALIRTSFEFAKDLFLRLLKMIIVPLILTSIVAGVLGVGDGEGIGRIGFKTLVYYLSTSTLAILTGLLMVNLIRPGVGAQLALEQAPTNLEVIEQTPLEFLIQFLLDLGSWHGVHGSHRARHHQGG